MRNNLFRLYVLVFLAALTAACGSGSGGGGGGNGNNITTNDLQCQGTFYSMSATVTGTRTYEPYNDLDGYVKFSGTIATSLETAQMQYEDYSNLAPYEGTIQSASAGLIAISVLDATGTNGDRMIIYEDVPTSGPPTILGQLTCVWF
jgi:hypothetical protein